MTPRLLSWVAVLAAAVLLADGAASVLLARETHPTAFDRWLGPAGLAAVGPSSSLAIQADAVTNLIDNNLRKRLTLDAQKASDLAQLLRSLGTPPAHEADVSALIEKLEIYADTARSLSACPSNCGLLIQTLASRLADVTLSVSRVHTAAAPRRGTGVFTSADP